jgi:hypothetical protein
MRSFSSKRLEIVDVLDGTFFLGASWVGFPGPIDAGIGFTEITAGSAAGVSGNEPGRS